MEPEIQGTRDCLWSIEFGFENHRSHIWQSAWSAARRVGFPAGSLELGSPPIRGMRLFHVTAIKNACGWDEEKLFVARLAITTRELHGS